MKANDPSSDYQVGFGKPPGHTRFRKGISGNPRGRPRGSKNLATVLERALQEKVVVDVNGMRKTVTKLEAAVMQLVDKAVAGDLPALRQLSALVSSIEVEAPAAQSQSDLTEADQQVMDRILVGYLLQQGDWHLIKFPAIAEEDERHVIQTPYGERVLHSSGG